MIIHSFFLCVYGTRSVSVWFDELGRHYTFDKIESLAEIISHSHYLLFSLLYDSLHFSVCLSLSISSCDVLSMKWEHFWATLKWWLKFASSIQ